MIISIISSLENIFPCSHSSPVLRIPQPSPGWAVSDKLLMPPIEESREEKILIILEKARQSDSFTEHKLVLLRKFLHQAVWNSLVAILLFSRFFVDYLQKSLHYIEFLLWNNLTKKGISNHFLSHKCFTVRQYKISEKKIIYII